MSEYPFRTALSVRMEEEIEEINQQEGYTYSRAFEPVEDATQRIEEQKNANEDRLRSWLLHPDERVACAFLDCRHKRPHKRPEHWQSWSGNRHLQRKVVREILDQAQAEGHLWTPLIDRLAEVGTWPSPKSAQYRKEGEPVGADQQANKLAEWVQNQTDPRELERLLAFDAEVMLGVLAADGQAWDQQLAEKVIELGGKKVAPLLVENDAFPQQLHEPLLKRARTRLEEFREQATGEERMPDRRASKIGGWTHWLGHMGQTGQLAPGEALSVLLDTFVEIPSKYGYFTSGEEKDFSFRYSQHIQSGMRKIGESLTSQQLAKVAQTADTSDFRLQRWLIQHPESDHRVWTAIWEQAGRRGRRNLVKHERAQESPEVRQLMFASGNWTVARELGEKGSPAQQKTLGQDLTERFLDSERGGRLGWRGRKQAKTLLDLQHLRPENLIQLYDEIQTKKYLYKIIEHPSANARVFRHILEETDSTRVRIRVSRQPEACQDSQCLPMLQRCRAIEILANLCRYSPADQIADIFRRLVRDDPEQAVDLLDENQFCQKLQALNKEDFTPLLRAQGSGTRRKVFRALAEVEPPEDDHLQEPSRTASSPRAR